ncbi:hypothetical protein BHE97_17740 [Aeromicrobium sp. PE09-221]|uniref:TRAP transporter large permease n=1 Tax=Aeromicrobium sp. PE09-221 TaxID=1898043 RepID=UPI000B3E50AD|nr:TRAP transporter large permease [Aeromicrobium sp. PE09-221]OUZ07341.1 hypothetical protein BHE97_17740 [Aeromicrobium sp. PE09-221]
MLVAVLIILFLGILLLRLPIGLSMLLVGGIGIILISGPDTLVGVLSSTAYRSISNPTYIAIPLFILMAMFLSESRVADELFDTIEKWVGRIPGGSGVTTVVASAGFGALSGSSVAATSVMARVAVPAMVRGNYSPAQASGLVATTTGTLAALIPPSIPLILYGVQTETSVGALLIAGIVPGLLIAGLIILVVVGMNLRSPNKATAGLVDWGDRLRSTRVLVGPLALIALIVGVIYGGVATATEASAFGAAGALLLGLAMRRLDRPAIGRALESTVSATSMVFLILIGTYVFTHFVTVSGVGRELVTVVEQSALSTLGVILLLCGFYLVLGLFLDLIGSMLLTLPVVFPLIVALELDPVWFGVLLVLLLEIGLVTPPIGLNLFIVSKHSGVPIKQVVIGSLPFIAVLLLSVGLLVAFPWLTDLI